MQKAFKTFSIYLGIISLVFVLSNCENKNAKIPEVSTKDVISVSLTRAKSGGNIISDGSATITESGICWNTNGNPTTNDFVAKDFQESNDFFCFLSNLSVGTTYRIRAYATNSKGTAYGNEVTYTHVFFCGQVIDADSNSYKTFVCNDLEIMAENLKVTKFNDGTPIDVVSDNSAWSAAKTPAMSWYDNNEANKQSYGALYNWYAVNSGTLCPKGWSVPNDSIWELFKHTLGGNDTIAYFLKESGSSHWTIDNAKASNESGFNALPGGFRERDGKFYIQGVNGFWWSATPHNEANAMYLYLDSKSSSFDHSHIFRTTGLSVRCYRQYVAPAVVDSTTTNPVEIK